MCYPLKLSFALTLIAVPALAAGTYESDAEFGRAIFFSLCVSCHKEDAAGDDRAPDIRGAPIAAIRRGTSGMDSMQDFSFAEEDILDIHAYLGTLAD